MLITWRYRKRKSLIQSFDPRAWIIFYGCFLASTILFWDLRFLLVLFAIALIAVFTSGIKWQEMRRAWLFIGGFFLCFSVLAVFCGWGGGGGFFAEAQSVPLGLGLCLFWGGGTFVLGVYEMILFVT